MVKVEVKRGLEFRRVGSGGILLDAEQGLFYRLSPGAAAYWEALVGGAEPQANDQVIAELAASGLVDATSPFMQAWANAQKCNPITDKTTCLSQKAQWGCSWNSGLTTHCQG